MSEVAYFNDYLFVGLPPEGEVSQKEFVELPSEKEKNKFDDPLNGSVNELLTKPVDESEIVELPIEESLSSPRKRMAHINNTRYIAYVSEIEFTCHLVGKYRGVFRTLSNIYDEDYLQIYFCKRSLS